MEIPWQSLLKIIGIVIVCYMVILIFIRAEVKVFSSDWVRKALSSDENRIGRNSKVVLWIILSVLIAASALYSLLGS